MKVIDHPRYVEVYADDPAASPGRIEAIRNVLEGRWDFLEPEPATEGDLLLAHTSGHVRSVKRDRSLYEVACLAVGGALLAARTAAAGEASFGLIRPPGHHASPDDCWGFCTFNNMAISLMALFAERKAGNAVVLDFDLHYGDGTVNCFSGDSRVLYLHPEESTPGAFLDRVTRDLALAGPRDILAVSAGFDRGKHDWGNLLGEDDYRTMGGLLKDYAAAQCGGRRYALLEGGYHHGLMGKYVQAFLEGFA